jgi:hypothetical protein
MQLPFSVEEFLGTFRAYNEAIGVAPLILVFLALGLVGLAHSAVRRRHQAIALGLAVLWLWSGAVYHWGFFTRVNPAAWLFGGLFVVQAILLSTVGAVAGRLRVGPTRGARTVAGWVLVIYALIAYPVAGWAMGHGYPAGPSFGAPCPLTIFTLGLMLWSIERIPLALVAIPIVWAAIGTSAALQLGIREDAGLAAAAVLVLGVIARQRWPFRVTARHGAGATP